MIKMMKVICVCKATKEKFKKCPMSKLSGVKAIDACYSSRCKFYQYYSGHSEDDISEYNKFYCHSHNCTAGKREFKKCDKRCSWDCSNFSGKFESVRATDRDSRLIYRIGDDTELRKEGY